MGEAVFGQHTAAAGLADPCRLGGIAQQAVVKAVEFIGVAIDQNLFTRFETAAQVGLIIGNYRCGRVVGIKISLVQPIENVEFISDIKRSQMTRIKPGHASVRGASGVNVMAIGRPDCPARPKNRNRSGD